MRAHFGRCAFCVGDLAFCVAMRATHPAVMTAIGKLLTAGLAVALVVQPPDSLRQQGTSGGVAAPPYSDAYPAAAGPE
ncbi:hypothetical protein [Mycobacterium sp. Marseille-P9652]|uniref:hypothetical protein n=1 Tax=Mycobacterium sp. Marseille-P9652 TaxID=2654950 RepID=UPI0018D0D652|nr:hypothetical protein [Mycobacterium sp. Marseille-P9652]